MDMVKLQLRKFLLYNIVNKQQYVKAPNNIEPEKEEILPESIQELIHMDNIDKKLS